MICDPSIKKPSVLCPHLEVNFRLLHKNYWCRLRNNVTKFGAPGNRTPPYSFDNPINDIYYINQDTVKHEH
jgi:hypothetical protein